MDIHITNKLTTWSTQSFQMTNEVNRSKKHPPPIDSFNGVHDFKYLFNHLPFLFLWALFTNSTEAKYGRHNDLNMTWITTKKSIARAIKNIATAKGNSWIELITKNSDVISANITPPMIMDMNGFLSTDSCRFDTDWTIRYFIAAEYTDAQFSNSLIQSK